MSETDNAAARVRVCSVFAEEDAEGCGFAGECGGERGGIGDFGDVGAAGLLGGFEGDAAPAFGSLGGGEGEVLLGAAGEDGRDAGDAQFGGLFDGPLEVVELEDGEEKVDGEGCVGFQLFVEGEEDFGVLLIAARGADFGDFGAVEEAVGDDVEELAGLGAEDAGEVDGLLAGEGGVGGMAGLRGPGVGDEAAAVIGQVQGTRYEVRGSWRSGFGEGDGDGVLVVELEGDGGGLALVPLGLGDGVVEQDHSFGAAGGLNDGLAQERRGGEGHERGEDSVEVGQVVFLEGGGGGVGAVRRGDGAGDVVERERLLEVVVDADGGEDVEVVLEGSLPADDLGVGVEDGVGGQDGEVGDGEVGGVLRDVEIDADEDEGKDSEGDEGGEQEAAAFGLCEGEVGHGSKHNAKSGCWLLIAG